MNLSESRYTAYCQCPKNLWYRVYHPEFAAVVDPAAQARFYTGSAVGEMDTWAMVTVWERLRVFLHELL